MSYEVGEIILAALFLGAAIGIRIWAHLKFLAVRTQMTDPKVQNAYDALRTASDVAFTFLILSLVWVTKNAWSAL